MATASASQNISQAVLGAVFVGAAALAAPAFALESRDTCLPHQIRLDARCAPLAEAADGVRRIVERAIAKNDLNSVILRISVSGRPLLSEAWGETMTGVPATTEMHFRSGAIAIAYLGTVLLKLAEEGVLSLDDKLAIWFPEFPNADRITIAMLADNTSGYPDYVDLEVLPIFDNVFRQWTPRELIHTGLSKPIVCEPGECFAYAHTNYVILGEVLRQASGREVADLIREIILEPLGLNDTRSSDTAEIPQPVLHAFDDERGLYEDATYWNPSWTLARGAIMTTNIYDVERSAVAIGTGSLISEQSQERMLAPTTTGMPPMTSSRYFGLGVAVVNGWILQTPSFHGYSAVMAYEPSSAIAIAVTTTAGPQTPEHRVTNLLFDEIGAYLAPETPPELTAR